MKIAVVGATGLVGSVMLEELALRGFAEHEIIPAASPKSVGKTIDFAGRTLTVVSPEEAIAMKPQYAIFSAGDTPPSAPAPPGPRAPAPPPPPPPPHPPANTHPSLPRWGAPS